MEAIGRYAVVERLGSGAFATVWLARDEDLDLPVAIKVLADNWSGDLSVRERFLSEAKILRRVSDPRVVKVLDLGTLADGRPYFVMDYNDGGTVADLMAGGITPRQALWIGAETAPVSTSVLSSSPSSPRARPKPFITMVDTPVTSARAADRSSSIRSAQAALGWITAASSKRSMTVPGSPSASAWTSR